MRNKMDENQEVCFLCEKPMSEADRRTVGERQIQLLREASVRRRDEEKLSQLQTRKYLSLHRSCHAAYLKDPEQQKTPAARPQSLRAAKSVAVERIKSDPALSVRTRSRSLDLYNFDFTTLCFVCGLPAIESGTRKIVKHVTSDSVRTDILQVIENQPSNNKYVQDIYQRLKPVDDLTKVCGRYHSDCLARLYRYQNFVPKKASKQANESPKSKGEELDEGDEKKEKENEEEKEKEKENDSAVEIKKSRLS